MGIPRAEVFLPTKLSVEVKSYDGAVASFEETVAALGMDHVDLYRIHAPWPWSAIGTDHRAGNAAVWRAMEEIHDAGRARAIGVSNFTVADLDALIGASRLTPQVNQIKFHIGRTQPETTAYCQANGILVEAYSPLARGALPLPKTTTQSRMRENVDLDFEISAGDLAYLDGLTDTVKGH